MEVNSLDPLPEEDDAPLHVSPEQLGASIKEAIDAGEYSINELVALSHLDIPGLDIEGEGAFDREALANITLAPPTDAEIRQSEHIGPGLLNFVEIPKPPEELDALLRGDIDPELYGRHVHGQGGTPEQMGVPVDDLRNQLPTRMPDGPAVAPASLTQAWDPLATPLDGVSRSHPSDPRRTTSDLAVPPGAATRHGTNERQGGYPHQGAPYPPTTGDPIADRAIQLTQGQFQQPNVLPTGQFDHAGFGQQAIRETLARLTGQSQGQIRGRSDDVGAAHINSDWRMGEFNNSANLSVPNSVQHQPRQSQEAEEPGNFLDRVILSFNGDDEDAENQRMSDADLKMLEALRDDPRRTYEERKLLQRLIDTGLALKETIDPDDNSRTLKAAFIPGRKTNSAGEQESLSPEDIKVLAEVLATSVSELPKSEMPEGVGGKPVDGAVISMGRGDRGNYLNFLVAENPDHDKDLVYAHETGHAVDYRSRSNPNEDTRDWILRDRGRRKDLLEASYAYRGDKEEKLSADRIRKLSPEQRRKYREYIAYRESSSELLADAFAYYMTKPVEFKEKFPELAKFLRSLVNDDEVLKNVISLARKDEGNGYQGSTSFA